jgi:hypothetical protein
MLADQGEQVRKLLEQQQTQHSLTSAAFVSPVSRTALSSASASQTGEMPKPIEHRVKQLIRRALMTNWLLHTLGQNKGTKRAEGTSCYAPEEPKLAFDQAFRAMCNLSNAGFVWTAFQELYVQKEGVIHIIQMTLHAMM